MGKLIIAEKPEQKMGEKLRSRKNPGNTIRVGKEKPAAKEVTERRGESEDETDFWQTIPGKKKVKRKSSPSFFTVPHCGAERRKGRLQMTKGQKKKKKMTTIQEKIQN